MERMWLDTSEIHGIKKDPPRKHLGAEKVRSCLEECWEGRGKAEER